MQQNLELVVGWVFKQDSTLSLPYQANLSALIHVPTFKKTAGEAVFSKTRVAPRCFQWVRASRKRDMTLRETY